MCRTFALCLLALPVEASDVRFETVPVPEHVYDGGWEHFVGGGVAVFDCNGDTLPDFVAAGGTNPAQIFENRGQMRFEATALSIKGTTGAYPLDLDGDDVLDLVVLRVGPDLVLRGIGDCRFEEIQVPSLTFEDRWSTAFSATWEPGLDKPTLAMGHYVDRDDPDGPFEACDTNTLWRWHAGRYDSIALSPGHCALSALFTDWARTGRADLRLSNDRHYYVRDGAEQLWAMETKPRLFTEADGWARHQLWGMGISARDIDRDGVDEVYLSSMGDQRLMRRAGQGAAYEDVPFAMGTAAQRPYIGNDGRPSTGWHIAFGDIQNDGREDAFIAKGNVQQMPGNAMEDPNNLLIQQADGRFAEYGDIAGVASVHRGRGAALADFDLDGRLDLVVVNRRAALELWRNVSETTGRWLSLDLRQPGANSRAVGAWIEVKDGLGVQTREITVGGGHAGGTALPQHFGVGSSDSVRVRVKWPHDAWSDWVEVTTNQHVTIRPDDQGLLIDR